MSFSVPLCLLWLALASPRQDAAAADADADAARLGHPEQLVDQAPLGLRHRLHLVVLRRPAALLDDDLGRHGLAGVHLADHRDAAVVVLTVNPEVLVVAAHADPGGVAEGAVR